MPSQSQGKPQEFLSLLRSGSAKGYASGQALADKAGISRSAVWKQIKSLRTHGYEIESLHGMGYRLTRETESPVPWELSRILGTTFIGRQLVYRDVTDSTQSIAIAIADRPSSHGVVVIAEQQKSGRGRIKRKWLSPKGGIWMSVVLQPKVPTAQITTLPFAAALAVCKAIQEATRLDARLKWPNDVMIGGKKVAGILLDISAEAERVNYAVIGIGINANVDSKSISAKVDAEVTSIKDELGREASRLEIVKLLLEKLEFYYLELEQHGPAGIMHQWRKNSDMLGRQVSVIQGDSVQTGVAADINEDGSLLLRTSKSDLNVVSGDIRVRY